MMRLTSGASRKEPQASHATGEIAMPHPGTGYGPGLSVADRSARYVMAALRRTIDIYGWAVVGIGLATIARMVLDPWLGARVPYTLYLPVILAVAAFRGTHAAVAAVTFGVIAGTVVVEPFTSDSPHILGLLIFCGVSAGIIALTRQIIAWRDQALAGQRVATRQAADARVMIDELTLLIDAAANHAIYFLDPGGTITLWSHSAERLSGWSAREAIGRSFDLLHTSADCLAGKPPRVLAAARASGRFRSRAVRCRKDGSAFIERKGVVSGTRV